MKVHNILFLFFSKSNFSKQCFICLVYGKSVKANIELPFENEPLHPGRNTVSYEARYLKWLLFEIIDY